MRGTLCEPELLTSFPDESSGPGSGKIREENPYAEPALFPGAKSPCAQGLKQAPNVFPQAPSAKIPDFLRIRRLLMITTAAMTNFEKQLQKRMTRMIENQIKAVIYVLLFLALLCWNFLGM